MENHEIISAIATLNNLLLTEGLTENLKKQTEDKISELIDLIK